MPINKVFELGRRAVKKRTRCFAGEMIGDEGEEGKRGIIIPKLWSECVKRKKGGMRGKNAN